MKQLFREWTGGGHKIHTTNSTTETNHDLVMLFGMNYLDYESSIQLKEKLGNKENNVIKILPQNTIGVDGWESLEKLFYVINETVQYVVLRNFESLPKPLCKRKNAQ